MGRHHGIKRTCLILAITILACLSLTAGTACAAGKGSITGMRPKDGATVSIVNSRTDKYWKKFEKGDGLKIALEDLKDGRVRNKASAKSVTLKWSLKDAGKTRYKVSIGEGPGMENKKRYVTSAKKIEVKNLKRATKYYWYVKAESGKLGTVKSGTRHFVTGEPARIIKVSGVSNFRDVGGYRTSSGQRTKQGMLYRCAKMDNIDKKGKKTLRKTLGVKTELDLRKIGEGNAGSTKTRLKYERMSGVHYKGMWESKDDTRRFIREMKFLADPDHYPVVFHCMAGKDRTGTLAYMVNGLLGVSKKDLRRDYELTYLTRETGTRAKVEKNRKRFEVMHDYMKKYKDPKASLQKNIRAFLLDNGMTEKELERIHQIMMEPAEEEPAEEKPAEENPAGGQS